MKSLNFSALFLSKPILPPRSNTFLLLSHQPRQSLFSHSLCSKKRVSINIPPSKTCTTAITDEEEGLGNVDGGVRIVAVVGDDSISPLKSVPWFDVLLHTAKRLKWVDEEFEMLVLTDKRLQLDHKATVALAHANLLLVVAVTDKESVSLVERSSRNVSNILCFESSPTLKNKLGGSEVQGDSNGSVFDRLAVLCETKRRKESVELAKTVSESWDRHNSDDIRFCLLVVINAYIRPVSTLKNLRAKGFSTLNCMVKNCGPQILNCLLDPNCRKALQCMNQCSPVDQVCNYKCIASYESPYLEQFCNCVLQKNNCLELDAKIPKKPRVPPMVKFRGENLTHEIAEDLFIGWLGKLDWSWKVVAGQNSAYDQFPCQYQLFYRGNAGGSLWFEPIYQVRTLEGDLIWRRRRYQVRRGKIPGTFILSALDNGVISNEFWTIVDVSDDFSWGLFHYHGAARVAGQSYSGAVVVSPDGAYPPEKEMERLIIALERCEIEEWELFSVDNSCCKDPPLGLPDGSRLHSNIVLLA